MTKYLYGGISIEYDCTYIRQLPKADKLKVYKAIKAYLVDWDILDPERVSLALDNTVSNLCFD